MTASNRSASFALTMKWEGGAGLSLVRADPGNWTGNRVGVGVLRGTKWGVAAGSYPGLDIAGLTEAQAEQIFAQKYWTPTGCDLLPVGLDHCVSDAAYNMGVGAANRLLVGCGITGASEPVAAIKAFSAARLAKMRTFSTWKTFGTGWARRVGGVEAESLRMAMSAQGDSPAMQEVRIAKHAETVQAGNRGPVGGAVVGTGAAVTPIAATGGHWASLLAGVLFAMIVLGFIAAIVANNARADGLLGKK